jgi:hypothetical protein
LTAAFRGEDDVQFQVAYGGPAVDAGRMDARALGPALYSIAQLIEDATATLYGPTAAVKIDVKADFHHGSFAFDLVAAPAIIDQVRGLVEQLDFTKIKTVLEVVGLVAGGTGTTGYSVIRFVRWLRNREVTRSVPTPSGREITVTGGSQIIVAENVWQLSQNVTVREDLYGVIKPLERTGIDELRSGFDAPTEPIVRRSDVEYFAVPEVGEEVLQDRVSTELVEVVAVSFREGNKWQLSRVGDAPFHAAILDEEFLRRVRRHELVFGSGDALRVRLRDRITRTADRKLHALREVVEVLEHMRPGEAQIDVFRQADAEEIGGPGAVDLE